MLEVGCGNGKGCAKPPQIRESWRHDEYRLGTGPRRCGGRDRYVLPRRCWPPHTALSRAFLESGHDDGYVRPEPAMQGPNKESRLLGAFAAARRHPLGARKLLDGLLDLLRLSSLLESGTGGQSLSSEDERRLRAALARSGWYLTSQGELRGGAYVDLETGGREALDEQLDRLRRSTADPALMIGTAKELLESVAKRVG
jgi:hypothetical protein